MFFIVINLIVHVVDKYFRWEESGDRNDSHLLVRITDKIGMKNPLSNSPFGYWFIHIVKLKLLFLFSNLKTNRWKGMERSPPCSYTYEYLGFSVLAGDKLLNRFFCNVHQDEEEDFLKTGTSNRMSYSSRSTPCAPCTNKRERNERASSTPR